jgi:putative transposase
MAWEETCVMEQRFRFLEAYAEEWGTLAELCRQYGVSRKTGYKWVARYQEAGLGGLGNQSRAPQRHPNEIAEGVQRRIIELRAEHPTWGPKKLHAWLERHETAQVWPARSMIGAILKRHGLSWARKKRNHAWPSEFPLQHAEAANQVWCADYKGWFLCGGQHRCYPLTITDAYSRYLLRCQSMRQTETETARAVFEATFREYGMPEAIRTDNGSPFASTGLQGSAG